MSSDDDDVVDIYPLSSYYFWSKDANPSKDETPFDRIQRMKANYELNGMRRCVEGILLVELFREPHLLVLQVNNSFFKLPGGRLRPGESEIDGLKRKFSTKLSVNENDVNAHWQVGECIGTWWRPDFETLVYPYLSSNVNHPKECVKLYLVKLPNRCQFTIPRNMKLLAVPLAELHENHKKYGPVLSRTPQLLSKFSFHFIKD